ncbi:hypothetical protein [Streptomyces chattanoogensis]|uniref:Uncharacterized protein n=1 Tax=Streptomyces chattanoogensis TaxID=66876 RepID=A0A0N0XV06_9ACTN|nr:hypothetical protein [Streptomyces chattanoogensis]KPC61166.1 hypothetical protein ADL29_25645 [Streptomyces chattanoogensis]
MTAEQAQPLYTPATHAPWREILRHRWSGRHDRALVLSSPDGEHEVLWPRRRGRRGRSPYDTAEDEAVAMWDPAARKLRGGYDRAYHVSLAERPATRAVRLRDEYGPEPVEVRLQWWVHDPAQVVRARTGDGWDAVRKDLDGRLRDLESAYASAGRPLGAAEVQERLAGAQELADCGLTYRVTDVRSRDADGELLLAPAGGGGLPHAWTASRREEYDFCLQAVRGGPASLAALWLLRHPDQVPDVLNWVAGNQGLVREEPNWQDEMAGLLRKLTEEEQGELSKVLRDRLVSLGRRVPPQSEPQGGGSGRPWDRPGRPPV